MDEKRDKSAASSEVIIVFYGKSVFWAENVLKKWSTSKLIKPKLNTA